MSECFPDQDEIVEVIHLPEFSGASQLCQELCRIQEDCQFWQRDTEELTCTLLSYSYLSSCLTISAGSEPDYLDCIAQVSVFRIFNVNVFRCFQYPQKISWVPISFMLANLVRP